MMLPPVRWSHLKAFAQSPAHYRYALERGRTDSAAMRLGRVVDALLFNGPKPAVFKGERRLGKDWEAFKEQHEGREIISDKEYGTALAMVDQLLDHSLAMEVLKGRRHLEINFTYLNRACQMHPDIVGQPSGVYCTDLKTGMTSDPRRFVRHALQMGYHGQHAFYGIGLRESGQGDPQNHYIVAQENKAPFVVTVFRLTERAIEHGERLVRTYFEQLLACEAANHWPPYAQTVVEFDSADEIELMFDEED